MTLISLEEFEKLPKSKPQTKLEPGVLYYIQDIAHPLSRDHDVVVGRFLEERNNAYYFENVDVLVSRFRNRGKPFAFDKVPRFLFMKVLDIKPTTPDIKRKEALLGEMKEYIDMKRAEPHDETPSVSFIGEDYREAKERFSKLPGSSKTPKGGKTKRMRKNKKYTRKNRKCSRV